MIATGGFTAPGGTDTMVTYEIYATDNYYENYHSISLDRMIIDDWPWKEYFWRWLRSYQSEFLTVLRRFKNITLWNKLYIKRMMFCKSGYLGKRIRKIRKSK